MAADLLERVRAELDARLAELRPAVAEYDRLLGATDMLRADGATIGPRLAAKPRASSKPRAATKPPSTKPRAASKPRAGSKPRTAAAKPGAASKPRAAAGKPRASTKPRAAAKPRAAGKPRAGATRAPARMGAGEQAIVAALEHGSHTVGELGVVTAMSGADIRQSARRLLAAGKVVRAKRDGRAAYALQGFA